MSLETRSCGGLSLSLQVAVHGPSCGSQQVAPLAASREGSCKGRSYCRLSLGEGPVPPACLCVWNQSGGSSSLTCPVLGRRVIFTSVHWFKRQRSSLSNVLSLSEWPCPPRDLPSPTRSPARPTPGDRPAVCSLKEAPGKNSSSPSGALGGGTGASHRSSAHRSPDTLLVNPKVCTGTDHTHTHRPCRFRPGVWLH